MSSAYHPQSNRQSEGLNKCLELYLRCFVHDYPKLWVSFLPWAEYWYNSTFQTSIGMTPFKVVYGKDPSSIIKCHFQPETPLEMYKQLK